MAILTLYQSNSVWTNTNYYDNRKIDASSTGWFQCTSEGVIFSQLIGNGITYDSYSNAVLGTITSARSINEFGDTNWIITGIGVQASNIYNINYALRTGDAFTDDMVNVILSGNDTINGTSGSDSFKYSAGQDVISGGSGVDVIDFSYYTYRGNNYNTLVVELNLNRYKVTTSSNVVVTSSIYGVENVIGSNSNDRISGNSSDNRLFGYDGDDIIYGGAGNDYINGGSSYYDEDQLYGEGGNDYIIASYGDNFVDGGNDSDTISYFGMDKSVYVDLSLNVGRHGYYNNYYNTWDYEDTLNNIENVVGTSWNDTILGNSSNNTISGGAGNDSLNGGSGIDTLDCITAGYNGVIVNLNNNTCTGQGVDSIYNFENIKGSNHNDTLIGNSLSNILHGNGGNDTLNGGVGADTMIGGAGNDTYYIDNINDITTETSTLSTEIDTVLSSVNCVLRTNIEKLTLIGATAINGTGNALNNTLLGNSAANILNGGLGNDTLTGGAGIDTFVFDSVLNATTNKDIITDFNVTDDTIRLDQTIFAKLTTLGTLSANFFRSSATGVAADSNDYILYNTATGALLYDADGSGTGAGIQFATLTNKPSLTVADFSVVA